MTNRWALAALVCVAALASYRFVNWPPGQHKPGPAHSTLKDENQTDRVQSKLHKAPVLGEGVFVEPSRLSENQFLTPNELFVAPLAPWKLEISLSSNVNDVAMAHFDFADSILPRLLIGMPRRVPLITFGAAHVELDCLGALSWMLASHWSKQLACSQRVEIRIKDEHGRLLERHQRTLGDQDELLPNKINVTIISSSLARAELGLPFLFEATLVPLTKRAIRRGLEDMLAQRRMSFADLKGAGPMEEFGFFINASITLRNPADQDHTVRIHCSGDLYMAAGTRGRPFQPAGRQRGFFNFAQYGAVEIPELMRRLDYYLGQGIENRALLLSQPDLSCKLLGDNFLMSALNSSASIVLKPTFPYLSWDQRLHNIKGILYQLNTLVQQVAGPRHSERSPQFKTIVRVAYTSQLANFSNAIYTRVINTPASSPASFFMPQDSRASRTNDDQSSSRAFEDIFSDPNQCAVPDVVDGMSTLVVNNLYQTNVAVNFSQLWSDSLKEHRVELYTIGTRRTRRQREIARQSRGAARNASLDEEEEEDLKEEKNFGKPEKKVASLMISDRRKADLTFIDLDLVRNWRVNLKELLDLNRESGRQRLLGLLKLVQRGRSADRRERLLLERVFRPIDAHRFELKERLQRCSTDRWLAQMPELAPQVSCLPDGDDNDLYVRQLYVHMADSKAKLEIACYPLKRQIVLERIQASLARLHKVNNLLSEQRLEGFVQDYLKLGAHCTLEAFNNSGFGETGKVRFSTVMAINETTSAYQAETDGDDHDTLVDQWNWLMEAVFAGRLYDGLMLDSSFEFEIHSHILLQDAGPGPMLHFNVSLLHQDSFPYLTYSLASARDAQLPMFGTINQTCHDKPVQSDEYQFLDLKTGINSILLSNEQDPAQQYAFDSFTRTSCSVYNTSYKIEGLYDYSNEATYIYDSTIRVNATDLNATSSAVTTHIVFPHDRVFIIGYGIEQPDKLYIYHSRCLIVGSNGTSKVIWDMGQYAGPDDESMSSKIVSSKETILVFMEILKLLAHKDLKKWAPTGSIKLTDLKQLLESGGRHLVKTLANSTMG